MLHLNTDLCALVLQKDLEYWQIDELILGNYNFSRIRKHHIIVLIFNFIAIFNSQCTFNLYHRAMLCPEVLSWNRNLCQRTKRWAGSKTKRSSKIRRWKFWYSRRWSRTNLSLEFNGISRNIKTSTGTFNYLKIKISFLILFYYREQFSSIHRDQPVYNATYKKR